MAGALDCAKSKRKNLQKKESHESRKKISRALLRVAKHLQEILSKRHCVPIGCSSKRTAEFFSLNSVPTRQFQDDAKARQACMLEVRLIRVMFIGWTLSGLLLQPRSTRDVLRFVFR